MILLLSSDRLLVIQLLCAVFMGHTKSQFLTVCQNCRTGPKIHPSIFIAPKIHHFYCTHSKIHIPFFLVFITHTQKSIFHFFWLPHAMSSPQRPPFPCLSPLGRTCASPCRRLSASSTAVYCTVPSLGEKSAEGISGYPCVALHVVFYAPCSASQMRKTPYFISHFCRRGAKIHISFLSHSPQNPSIHLAYCQVSDFCMPLVL